MADGSLPKCRLVGDVRGYVPVAGEAEAECVAGGFPCQVKASEMIAKNKNASFDLFNRTGFRQN